MSIECARCGATNGPGETRCYRCNAHLPVTLTIDQRTRADSGSQRSRRHRSEDGRRGDAKYERHTGRPLPLKPSPADVPFDLSETSDVFTSAEAQYDAPSARSQRRLSYSGGRLIDAAEPSAAEGARPAADPRDLDRATPELIGTDEQFPTNPEVRPRRDESDVSTTEQASPPILGPVTYVPGKGIVPQRRALPHEETRVGISPLLLLDEDEDEDPIDLDGEHETTLVGDRPDEPVEVDMPHHDLTELGASFETDSRPKHRSLNPVARGAGDSEETRVGIVALSTEVQLEFLNLSGEVNQSVPLERGRTIIGREHGDVILASDPTVAPWHAQLMVRDDAVTITDMGTANGVYVRAASSLVLEEGDSLTCGGQRFLFTNRWREVAPTHDGCVPLGAEGYDDPARLILYREGGQVAGIYFVGDALMVGRSRGDVLFPNDEAMGDAHFSIRRSGGEFIIVDLDSPLGVFRRISSETRLQPGDSFQVGRTRLRITY